MKGISLRTVLVSTINVVKKAQKLDRRVMGLKKSG